MPPKGKNNPLNSNHRSDIINDRREKALVELMFLRSDEKSGDHLQKTFRNVFFMAIVLDFFISPFVDYFFRESLSVYDPWFPTGASLSHADRTAWFYMFSLFALSGLLFPWLFARYLEQPFSTEVDFEAFKEEMRHETIESLQKKINTGRKKFNFASSRHFHLSIMQVAFFFLSSARYRKENYTATQIRFRDLFSVFLSQFLLWRFIDMSNRSVFFYPNRENLVGVEELLPALKLQWHLSSTGENDQYSLYISEKNSSESYHMAVHALKEAKVPFFTETQRHCIMIPTHTLESRLALANRHLDIILAICREKKILFEQQYLSYQQMLNNVFLTPRLWEKTFSFSSQNLPRIGLKLSITDNIPKIRQTLLAFFRSITTENNIDIKPTHCGLFDIVPLSPDQSEKMNTLLKELAREEKNDNISTHSAHYFPQPRYIENSESHRENSSFPSFLTFIGNNWTSIFSDRRSHAPIVSSPEKPFYSWLDGVISTQTNAVFSIQTSYTQQQPEKYIFLDLDLFPDIEKNSPLHQKIQHFLSAPKMGDGTNCLKRLSGETRWCTHQINEKTYSVNLQYEIKIPSSPARLFCYEVPGDLQNQRHPLIITALYDSQGLHDGHRLSKQKIHAWRYHENGKISLIAHVEEEIFTPSPLN